MPTLQIDHPVADFEAWRRAFEADPLGRRASGVRGYRVYREPGEAPLVRVDLDFGTVAEAEAFRGALQRLWGSGPAASLLRGAPTARIVEEVLSERDPGDRPVRPPRP